MKKAQIILSVLFMLVFLIISNMSFAQKQQDVSSTDLSKIQVDELSDDQIQMIADRIGTSGMTEDQLMLAAKSKGMPNAEILKLKARILNLGSTSTTTKKETAGLTNDDLNKETPIKQITNALGDQIFGFSWFTNKLLSFEPSSNIATPLNYQLGPGDKLTIDVWGASQTAYTPKITSDGNIIITNVGPIYISGMTIDEATIKIKKELSMIYSGLLIGETFVKISLSSVRSIKVNIVGDVTTPGTYTLSSLSTVLNALYLAGGPALNGSLRDIKIIRNNKTTTVLDFYEFILKGELPGDMRLQDEDVIFVSTYKKRVQIKGEVKRKCYFDMKPFETLKDLIYYAGGYTGDAYSDRILVHRKTGKEYKVFDVPLLQQDTFKLVNGDEVYVDKILDKYENRVQINGAVMRPGVYAIDSVLTLGQLIKKADGLRGDAFLNRISVYRTLENFDQKLIPVSLTDSVITYDFKLQKEDSIIIPSAITINIEGNFYIEGEVRNPGNYKYALNTTVEDLILQAGGLLESATYATIEVARRIRNNMSVKPTDSLSEIYQFQISKDLKLTDSAAKFILEKFDNVFIRKSPVYSMPTLVKVEGQVLYPGYYSINTKSERISDLIKRAGNITSEAYVKGVQLIRQIPAEKQKQLKDLQQFNWDTTDSTMIKYVAKTESTVSIDLEKILKNPGSKYDLFLQKGDVLKIPKEPQTIGISGALLYPVVVRYVKGYGVRKYISSSGGFTDDAMPSKIYVLYANGSARRTHNFLFFNSYPNIDPGAEIIVPRKTEHVRASKQETIAFATAMASLALIIITIVNAVK